MISLTTTLHNRQLREDLHRLLMTDDNHLATAQAISNICRRYKCPPKYIEVIIPVDDDTSFGCDYTYVKMNGADFLFLAFIQFQFIF